MRGDGDEVAAAARGGQEHDGRRALAVEVQRRGRAGVEEERLLARGRLEPDPAAVRPARDVGGVRNRRARLEQHPDRRQHRRLAADASPTSAQSRGGTSSTSRAPRKPLIETRSRRATGAMCTPACGLYAPRRARAARSRAPRRARRLRRSRRSRPLRPARWRSSTACGTAATWSSFGTPRPTIRRRTAWECR